MIVIVTVENNNGLLFNHRRVSRDRVLRERILGITGSSRLLMDAYSSKQFEQPLPDNIMVSEDFLSIAQSGDYVFVEDRHLLPYTNRIEQVILFRWNRDYPSDFKLDFIPAEHGFYIDETEDFPGSSHEKITMEVWKK